LYVPDADNHVVEVTDDVIAWGRFMEDERRHIGYTQITSACTVSTVFIGIDHRIYGKGPPVLFETMIFGGPLDHDQWRYSSYDDAVTGHAAAANKARAAIGQRKRKAPNAGAKVEE
jgi:hypothetical protein